MPKFIHDSTDANTPLGGTYDFRGGVVEIPSGNNVTPALTGAQIQFVPASGKILIASGTTWANLQGVTPFVAPSMEPNDPAVFNVMTTWVNESGLLPEIPGTSGADEWLDGSPVGATFTDFSGKPSIASGTQNGLNAAWFDHETAENMMSTTNGSWSPYSNQDKPITVIAACRRGSRDLVGDWGHVFSVGHQSHGNEDIISFGIETVGQQMGTYVIGSAPDVTALTMRVGDSTNQDEWMVLSWVLTGSQAECYKNGVEQTAGPSGYDVANMHLDSALVGGRQRTDQFKYCWDGMIGEVCVYSSGLASGTREQIEQSLMNKWGI